MELFVRRADRRDVEALNLLEYEARAQLTKFRGGKRLAIQLPQVGDLWVERVDSSDWLVLVTGFDDVVLGYLCVNMAPANSVPLIERVYVTAEARQLGLGDGLVTAAIELSQTRGAGAIDAYALPGDRETKNLFERCGLTARLLIVSKQLGEEN